MSLSLSGEAGQALKTTNVLLVEIHVAFYDDFPRWQLPSTRVAATQEKASDVCEATTGNNEQTDAKIRSADEKVSFPSLWRLPLRRLTTITL